MNNADVIIIGAGAAGLMAAGHSAECGAKVLLLEQMNQPGRKLSITGKGKCNLTNLAPSSEFVDQVKPDGRFLKSAFSSFYNTELIDLLNRIGIETTVERGQRVFPLSGSAPEVSRLLVAWCRRHNVELMTGFTVKDIKVTPEHKGTSGRYIVSGLWKNDRSISSSNRNQMHSLSTNNVLITTGGLSYPGTGSTGDGYKWAKTFGHTISDCRPSLVPLDISPTLIKLLAGIQLKNVRAYVRSNNEPLSEAFGEVHFTKSGLSGPVILTLSRIIVPEIMKGKNITIKLDLKPALNEVKLDNRLIRDFEKRGHETIQSILRGILPKQMVPMCIRDTGISPQRFGNQITNEERSLIGGWVKSFDIVVNNYRPFSEAIITAGGVKTSEINQKTMESKKHQGLYFAGEILDLDGPTGGYNLQIAFSTAWAAAVAIITSVPSPDKG